MRKKYFNELRRVLRAIYEWQTNETADFMQIAACTVLSQFVYSKCERERWSRRFPRKKHTKTFASNTRSCVCVCVLYVSCPKRICFADSA